MLTFSKAVRITTLTCALACSFAARPIIAAPIFNASDRGQVATLPPDSATIKPVLRARLDELARRSVGYLSKVPRDPYHFPLGVSTEMETAYVPSDHWTSGFYPGTLWYLYGHSKDQQLGAAAREWTSFIEREQYNTHTHDLGFMVGCSFGTGMQVANEPGYEQVLVRTARSLASRYNDTVGCIRSWDWGRERWTFPVIIDNMMNLEILYAAAKLTGDTSLSHVATQHARTTMEHHFRADNSTYHVVDYWPETGRVRGRMTFQGYSDASAWARGQAWGLYGYTVAYRETGDPAFLAQATKIADFIFSHPRLPADLIPYWDYDAPDIPNVPRDASAATVTASALVKLAALDAQNRERYLGYCDRILRSLEDGIYQSEHPPFLLDHSVGAMPLNHEVDRPINYADYYYVEALVGRLNSL